MNRMPLNQLPIELGVAGKIGAYLGPCELRNLRLTCREFSDMLRETVLKDNFKNKVLPHVRRKGKEYTFIRRLATTSALETKYMFHVVAEEHIDNFIKEIDKNRKPIYAHETIYDSEKKKIWENRNNEINRITNNVYQYAKRCIQLDSFYRVIYKESIFSRNFVVINRKKLNKSTETDQDMIYSLTDTFLKRPRYHARSFSYNERCSTSTIFDMIIKLYEKLDLER